MLFTLPLLFAVAATAAVVERDCTHDNCLRAVIASEFPTRSVSADCSSYFLTTVTPATTTFTATVTTTASVDGAMKRRSHPRGIEARQMTVVPSNIPAYASACSGSVRYSSACSCIGATGATTTAPTPSTTVTVTSTTTVTAVPTLIAVQYYPSESCEVEGDVTTTPAPLGKCVITDDSYSLNFQTFIPGACTPAECSVNFYGAADCSGPILQSPGVSSAQCYNFVNVFAIMLVCPTCP